MKKMMWLSLWLLIFAVIAKADAPKSKDGKTADIAKFPVDFSSKYDEGKISKKVLEAIEVIKKQNVVMGDNVGYAGTPPPQAYIVFKKEATDNELMELTRHPNAVVRCCAIRSLSIRSNIDLFSFILEHLNDTVCVYTLFGCIGQEEKVGDFFIDCIKSKLTQEQNQKLEDILLLTPNELITTALMLESIDTRESYYSRIRELSITNKYPEAVVALAKFKREDDLKIILDHQKNSLFYTYRAISYFPHPFFMDFLRGQLPVILKGQYWSTEWREYYNAVAAYNNDEAVKIFRTAITSFSPLRSYHVDFIFGAISSCKAEIYDQLLFDLWRSDNKITPAVFDYLWRRNQSASMEILPRSLREAYLLYD